MQFEIWTKGLAELSTDCVAVGVHDDGELTPEAKVLDLRCREKLSRLVKRGDFTAKAGETWLAHRSRRNSSRTRAAGRHRPESPDFDGSCTRKAWRRAVAAAIGAATRTRIAALALALPRPAAKLLSDERLGRAVAEITGHTLYRVNDLKSGKKPRAHALARVHRRRARESGSAPSAEGFHPGQRARLGRRAHAQPRQPARQCLHALATSRRRRRTLPSPTNPCA